MEVIFPGPENAAVITCLDRVILQVLVCRFTKVIQRVVIVARVIVSYGSADQHTSRGQTVDWKIELFFFGWLGDWVEVESPFFLDEIPNVRHLYVGQVFTQCNVLPGAWCLAGFVVPKSMFDDVLDFIFIVGFIALEQVFKRSLLFTFFNKPVWESVHFDFLEFVWYFDNFHDFGAGYALFAEFQFIESIFEQIFDK